jgi:hypothetical protein
MIRVFGLLGMAFLTLATLALLNPPQSLTTAPTPDQDKRKRNNPGSPRQPGGSRNLYLAQFSLN